MMPTLRLGSLGEPVTTLQSALNLWSGSNDFRLIVDGFFGLSTNSKVREYQLAHQLVPDGVVGPLTWESLRPLVEHVLGTVPPAAHEHDTAERIVRAHAGARATAAPSRTTASRRTWTATPSARREARYFKATTA